MFGQLSLFCFCDHHHNFQKSREEFIGRLFHSNALAVVVAVVVAIAVVAAVVTVVVVLG